MAHDAVVGSVIMIFCIPYSKHDAQDVGRELMKFLAEALDNVCEITAKKPMRAIESALHVEVTFFDPQPLPLEVVALEQAVTAWIALRVA